MRHSKQLPLTPPSIAHRHAAELEAISALLAQEPRLAALVEQDLLRACAKNPVALLVPCHRAVRSDGSLAGYRWGVARKRKLLEREGKGKKG